MSANEMTAQQAIAESARRGETVYLLADEQTRDELQSKCEDSATENDGTELYWGWTDRDAEDGDYWAVALEVPRVP